MSDLENSEKVSYAVFFCTLVVVLLTLTPVIFPALFSSFFGLFTENLNPFPDDSEKFVCRKFGTIFVHDFRVIFLRDLYSPSLSSSPLISFTVIPSRNVCQSQISGRKSIHVSRRHFAASCCLSFTIRGGKNP